MAYLSLYRKYRSQSFDEVSGQDHVTRTLQNAIRTGRVAHAYLFCGPRGTGKTSTARLLAKALNCDNGPTSEPCNVCAACTQIAEGRYLDIKEIDAASNRGIEDIRDLRDTVAYAPTQGRYKVYVIDEAHQITGDAFNAFLKTLEEPPPYVVFIMATTEVHKIPATIVSRCQRFEFRRATMEDLRSRVAYVAAQEGATIDDTALSLIAREANGGWRDALSLLEQVLAFCDSKITAKEVYSVLGTVEADTLHSLGDCILSGNGGEAIRLLDELICEGKDPRQLLRDLTMHFRSLMLSAAGAAVPGDPQLVSRIQEQARQFGQSRLIGAIEVLAQTDREARWSEQPKLLLELAVVRLMHPRGAVAAEPLPTRPAARTEPVRAEPVRAPAAPARPAATPTRPPLAAVSPNASPFVEEEAPIAPSIVRDSAPAAFGTTPLPPPPLTVGDARFGGSDDDDDLALFDNVPPPAAGPEPPPARPPITGRPPIAARATPPVATPIQTTATSSSIPASAGGASFDVELVRRKWRLIHEELKRDKKAHVQAVLVDTEPEAFEQDTLVLRFPYKTMADVFAKRSREFEEALSGAIQRVTGITCRIRPEAGGTSAASAKSGPKAPAAPARSTAKPAPSVTVAELPAAQRPPAAAPMNSSIDLTHEVLEIFDGRIVDERDHS
jgi:DNA polymerase-3 subunit gamma/tau